MPDKFTLDDLNSSPSLSRDSHKPLYLQIYEELCEIIEKGNYRPGDQFPTELDLVDRYAVGRITVRRAITELVQEGRLVRRAGKGTFVAAPKIERHLADVSNFTERMRILDLHASANVVEVKVIPATIRVAKELDADVDTPVLELVRLGLSDDVPLALETSFLSLERCPGLDALDFSEASLYELLNSHYGLRPVSSEKTLEIAAARTGEAKLLGVRPGAPLFLLRARVLAESAPIEYVKILLRGDRFRFKV